MRTLLSHEDTAKWFARGDHLTLEMLSSGPLARATSFEIVPVKAAALFVVEDLVAAAVLDSPQAMSVVILYSCCCCHFKCLRSV